MNDLQLKDCMDIRFILLIFISLGNAVKAASMPALPPYRMPQWLTITEQAFKASSQVAYQQGNRPLKRVVCAMRKSKKVRAVHISFLFEYFEFSVQVTNFYIYKAIVALCAAMVTL